MSGPPALQYGLSGDGPAVLLLHGLGGDREQSYGLLPEGAGLTRLAPEMPGHGRTKLSPADVLTFPHFAARTAALIDDLQRDGLLSPGAVPVVGVSMGAGIALALAGDWPELIRKMVLVRPAWLDKPNPPHLRPFTIIAELLTELTPAAAVAAFQATPEFRHIAELSPAMADSLLRQFQRPDARHRARVLAAMPASIPLQSRDAYRSIRHDTLIISAPGDPAHPEWLAQELATLMPTARQATVPPKTPDARAHQQALQRTIAAELARA